MSQLSKELVAQIESYFEGVIPQVSVNCVIFRYHQGVLEVAVVDLQFMEHVTLPGGFVHKDEDVVDAASRVVLEQTGVHKALLRQVGVFGKPDRKFEGFYKAMTERGAPDSIVQWLSRRFLSLVYYCVVHDIVLEAEANLMYSKAYWMPFSEIATLAMDHTAIVQAAKAQLEKDINAYPVVQNLMPERFTIPQLLGLYEAICGRVIDRGNFRQRILKNGILEDTGAFEKQPAGRPALVYKFNQGNYNASLCSSVKLGF